MTPVSLYYVVRAVIEARRGHLPGTGFSDSLALAQIEARRAVSFWPGVKRSEPPESKYT